MSLKFRYLSFLFLLLFTLFIPISVSAQEDQSELYYTLVSPLYDPTVVYQCTGGNNTVLVGEDNAEKIWNYLTDGRRGLTPVQAAGIMGNLKQESGYNPDAREPNGIGYGIAQWSFGRRTALEAEADKLGVPVSDLAFQLDYLWNESQSRTAVYPPNLSGENEWEGMKQMEKVDDAVIYWEKNFERAGTPVLGQRLAYANEELNRFGSGSNGSGEASVANCDNVDKTDNDVEFVSWNVLKTTSSKTMLEGIESFASQQVDIVGLQEVSFNGKPQAIKDIADPSCDECFFSAYRPESAANGGNVPILWRKARFSLEDSGYINVHGRVSVEPGAGSEDGTESPMSVTYVQLKDSVTGKSLWIMNVHTIATVESKGKPNGLDKRLAVYEKTMDVIIEATKNKNGPVFVLGDFNVDYKKDSDPDNREDPFPYRKLGIENNIISNWQYLQEEGGSLPDVGTLGYRFIDYVFAKRNSDVSFRSTLIGQKYGSDHRSVSAIYRISF